MEIVIIGTGNTATVLGKKLKVAGHKIAQVFGRDSIAASKLAYELDTKSTNYWNVVTKQADIYILAVSDIAIDEIIHELNFPDKTIVHTAGSVNIEVLHKAANHFGVLYPLQSLKKEGKQLPDLPIIIDASDKQTLLQIEELATSISNKVVIANDDQRLKLHLAAVFCNNFVNHLYTLIEEYCKKENIDFSLLFPLIKETGERATLISPSNSQTGPAIRNDKETIEKHLNLLKSYPELENIYKLMTASIRQNTSLL